MKKTAFTPCLEGKDLRIKLEFIHAQTSILVSCFLSGYITVIFPCTCGLQKSVGFPFHFFSELEGEQFFALHASSNEQQKETRKKMNEPKRRSDVRQFITISDSVLINGFHQSTRILSASFRASPRAMFTSFSTLVSEWSHISAFTVRKFLTNI